MVRPADIYVLCGLLASGRDWTYRTLASDLRVPHPVVQRALARAEEAGLYVSADRQVHLAHFEEFSLHGLRFLAPVKLGPIVPGIPAAWAARPVSQLVRSTGEDLPPVWPAAEGRVRGQSFPPLHDAAVDAVEDQPALGELLAIVDSLRAADPRIRSVAATLLSEQVRERMNAR